MSDKFKALMQDAANRGSAWRAGIDRSIRARQAMLGVSLATAQAVEQEQSSGLASILRDSAKDGADVIEWSVGERKVRIRAAMDGMIVVHYETDSILQAKHEKLSIPTDDAFDGWIFQIIEKAVLFLRP